MRRWMIYLAAMAAAFSLKPKQMKDVGDLIPVELLYVSKEAAQIRVETDTGNVGLGKDLQSALRDLKETAPGEMFLETADYLIVTKRTAYLLDQLTQVLRPAAEVCIGLQADTQAVSYLKAHPTGVTMKDIKAGRAQIPMLVQEKGRYRFGEIWRPGENA